MGPKFERIAQKKSRGNRRKGGWAAVPLAWDRDNGTEVGRQCWSPHLGDRLCRWVPWGDRKGRGRGCGPSRLGSRRAGPWQGLSRPQPHLRTEGPTWPGRFPLGPGRFVPVSGEGRGLGRVPCMLSPLSSPASPCPRAPLRGAGPERPGLHPWLRGNPFLTPRPGCSSHPGQLLHGLRVGGAE